MDSLVPIAIGGASIAAMFWDNLKGLFNKDPDKPPHAEMSKIIKFFRNKEHEPGLNAAMQTGKFIYDADTQLTPEPKGTKE